VVKLCHSFAEELAISFTWIFANKTKHHDAANG
jgi:hypothetical protein